MKDIDFSHLEPLGAASYTPTVDGLISVSRDERAGSRTYRLLVPLKIKEAGKTRRLSQICMRHPSQQEVDDWGRGDIDGKRALICRMIGQPFEVFAALSWPDATALHQMFSDMAPDFIVEAEI